MDNSVGKQKLIEVIFFFVSPQIDIEFIVADGSVNTVLRPVINVCACENQGICTSVTEDNDDNSDDSNDERFHILSCICQNGYTGELCEADLDACEENFQPCYPGVDCNDLPPPANATGFECDPCPSGYSGNGIQCLGTNISHNVISSLEQSPKLYIFKFENDTLTRRPDGRGGVVTTLKSSQIRTGSAKLYGICGVLI